MKKKVYIAVGCIAGLALVFAFITLKNDTPVTEKKPITEATADQPASPSIRQDPEFIKSLYYGPELRNDTDSEGIHTVGYVPVEEGQRILEVRFLKRDIKGNLSSLPLHGFSMSDRGAYVAHGASGIRMAVSEVIHPSKSSRMVKPDVEYKIDAISLSRGSFTFTSPLDTTFTIPKDLPPYSIYKIELVVLDEQLNKKLADEKELQRQRAVQESIAVDLTKVANRFTLPFAYYMEEGNERPFDLETGSGHAKENSKMVIRGPNKLGGELIVADIMEGSSGMPFLWSRAYIRKLNKRSVNIPEDADLIIEKNEMIPVTVDFDTANTPATEKLLYLGLFEKADSKLPLLTIVLDTPKIEMKDNRYELNILSKPGLYSLRLLGHRITNDADIWSNLVDLGTIEIKSDQQHYNVKIPESTDWKKIIGN